MVSAAKKVGRMIVAARDGTSPGLGSKALAFG